MQGADNAYGVFTGLLFRSEPVDLLGSVSETYCVWAPVKGFKIRVFTLSIS